MTVSTLLQHETLGKADHYGTYVSAAVAVDTSGTPHTYNFYAPSAGSGIASFGHYEAISTNADGVPTYNAVTFRGYNAGGADLTHHIWEEGFESSWYDPTGDHHLGAEWYIQYFSKDRSITYLRPFYARVDIDNVTTTVAAGSNGVNTSTFAGAGTLNVASTTGFGYTGTVTVATGGTPATITYTGKTGTTFTGCTTTAGGGVLATGGSVSGPQNGSQTYCEIGTDSTGNFDIVTSRSDVRSTAQLFHLTDASCIIKTPSIQLIGSTQVQLVSPSVYIAPLSGAAALYMNSFAGQATIQLNSASNGPYIDFKVAGVQWWRLIPNSSTVFTITDLNSRTHVTHTSGANSAAAISEFASQVRADSDLYGQYGAATQVKVGAAGPASQSGISFQSGEANSNLYRSGAGTLKTDGSLAIGNTLAVASIADAGINVVPIQLSSANSGTLTLGTTAGQVGFFNGVHAAKQTVTGSKGANAALTSLLTALAAYNLVTDSST